MCVCGWVCVRARVCACVCVLGEEMVAATRHKGPPQRVRVVAMSGCTAAAMGRQHVPCVLQAQEDLERLRDALTKQSQYAIACHANMRDLRACK